MKIGAGIAGILLGIIALFYVGIFGGMVGSAAGWLGSLGPGSSSVTTWASMVSLISWLGPLLSIAGGIVTFSKPRPGAILLAASAALLWYLLGLGFVGKIFVLPIGVAAVLAWLSAESESYANPTSESTAAATGPAAFVPDAPTSEDRGRVPTAQGFDRAKWEALVKYDSELSSIAERVGLLGAKWLEELAASYMALNDKAYLPAIEQKIFAAAKAEAEESARAKARQEERQRALAEEQGRRDEEERQQRESLAQERKKQRQLLWERTWSSKRAKIQTIALASAPFLVAGLIWGGVALWTASEQRRAGRDVAPAAEGRSGTAALGNVPPLQSLDGRSSVTPDTSPTYAERALPAPAGQMGMLCSILSTSRSNHAGLEQQIANERNPLRRDSLSAQEREVAQEEESAIKRFLATNERKFSNFNGVIKSMRTMLYSNGPGVEMTIGLPCDTNIWFQFLDISPQEGEYSTNLYLQETSPLSKWRVALENIVEGDVVTFSGRFTPGPLQNPRGIDKAVLTELRKNGGAAYKVPDEYLLREEARRAEEARKTDIALGIARQLSGRWEGEWKLTGFTNPLARNGAAFALDIERNGSVLTGKYQESGRSASIFGNINGTQISFDYAYTDGTTRSYAGTIDGSGEVSGKWNQGNSSGTWRMIRATSAPAVSDETGSRDGMTAGTGAAPAAVPEANVSGGTATGVVGAAPAAVVGNWLTRENDWIMEITQLEDGTLQGTVVGSAYPGRRDIKNPDASLRDREFPGVVVMHNVRAGGAVHWSGGTFYNPDDGRTYKVSLDLQSDGSLKITGFLGLSPFGRVQYWTRYVGSSMDLPVRQK